MITLLIRFFKRNVRITSSDERIEKESNSVLVGGYIIAQIAAVLVLIYTLIAKLSVVNLVVPIGYLVMTNGYLFVKMKSYELGFKDIIKGTDECIITIRNKIFKEGYFLGFYFIFLADLLVIIMIVVQARVGINSKNVMSFIANYSYSFLIIIISSLYITVLTVKKGLMVPMNNGYKDEDGKLKKKEFNPKKFRIRCLKGAIFFGVFMGLVRPGHFEIWKFLKVVVVSGGIWGLLFYFLMMGMIKISGKSADKRADEHNHLDK
ncbi:hypothetical protein [uncultured Clostridium sp.]|jgi:hypothetical protein|uniref:hypothetical protein n=1 Tax=uncultured Clostridium sp. TaxID=59620 RepID=UPI00262BDCDB|nr:hypothetical protein [uncultured Clostridium sp.]